MYTVYLITCVINNKKYIGYTSQSLDKRWKSHIKNANYSKNKKSKILNAIKKYGERNFTVVSLFESSSKEEALKKEIELILQLDTINTGLNISPGGEPGNFLVGPRPEICGQNNPFYGKKHTDETKRKIAQRDYSKQSGKNHPMYGKTTATSFKSGSNHPQSKSITINNETYESISLMTKAIGIPKHIILNRIKNKQFNFTYKNIDYSISVK